MRDPILVVGGSGYAGRMHRSIYASAGWDVIVVDPRVAEDTLPPGELAGYIIDICTPTATHASTLVEYYRRGARRFIVEKPQAVTAAEWSSCRAMTPDAIVFSVHNYLWSDAFICALDAVEAVDTLITHFDKDRRVDDWNGRGSHHNRLAHVLQVEAPHQFAMATWVWPDLAVSAVAVEGNRYRTADRWTPSAAIVELNTRLGHAALSTDLRAPIRRDLTLSAPDGRRADVEFSLGGLLPARVRLSTPDGGGQTIWSGSDDALGRNLRAAVRGFDATRPDPRLGEGHSSTVLRCLDEALTAAGDVTFDTAISA